MVKLTFEDKLSLVTGKGPWHTNDCNGKLRSIRLSDGPHGLRIPENEETGTNNMSLKATCFPTASAMACSWNTDSIHKMAEAIAKEAIACNVGVVLGCGINIKRSPLCGRNFEYFSEDPFLTGVMATSYIQAMESMHVGTSLKHFACNNQEKRRQTANSEIDERALREIYLSAFEMVIHNARPATVMASYNRINGEYACTNYRLLTDILRKEWGYKGTVISDWGAVTDLPRCIQAGLDLEMPDSQGLHLASLRHSLEQGILTEESFNRAVNNVVKLAETYSHEDKQTACNYDDHKDLAKELELESAVLLKNDGMLPVNTDRKILILGDMAESVRFQGGGSSHINPTHIPDILHALTECGYDYIYAKGYKASEDLPDAELEQEALTYARSGLPVLIFGGLPDRYEGEGFDRTSLSLPANQIHLIESLYEVNKDLAFISFTGSPVDYSFEDKVKAILQMYLGGQSVDQACADLLSGRSCPCGKLAESYPYALEDVPSYNYFGKASDDVEYRESIFTGYRYYDTYNIPVRYTFGHGLSYTTFRYSDLVINKEIYSDGDLTVRLKVANTGNVTGSEIVQIYVGNPDCNYLRPSKELRGFTKVSLGPGEIKDVCITLNKRSFSIYDADNGEFIVPSGTYTIMAASSLKDIRLSADITVQGVNYDPDMRAILSDYFNHDKGTFSISKEQFAVLYKRPLSDFDHTKKGDFTIYNSLETLAKHSLLGRLVVKYAKHYVASMFKGKPSNDPEVMMFGRGFMEGTLDSVICQSQGAVPYSVGEAIVLSANGHHYHAIKKLLLGR